MFKYALTTMAVVSLVSVSSTGVQAKSPLGIKSTCGVKTKDATKNKMEADFHFNRGEDYRERKQYTEAISEYEKAIKACPSCPTYYKNLGGTYALLGKYQEAEAILKKGTKIAPNDWLMWNNLAYVLKQEKKKQECEAALKQTLSLNPPTDKIDEIKAEFKNLDGLKTSSK